MIKKPRGLRGRIGAAMVQHLSTPGSSWKVTDNEPASLHKLQVAVNGAARLRNWKVTTCTHNGALIATRIA